jgi:hypothetical protein
MGAASIAQIDKTGRDDSRGIVADNSEGTAPFFAIHR